MRLFNLALGLILLFGSCSKNGSDGDLLTPGVDSAAIFSDVSYGKDSKQKLDVYLPALRNERTRMVIVIHGGGWNTGDKSDYDGLIAELQKNLPDYAFANLNYRLVQATGNYFPTQENDVNAAVSFLKSKSKEYHISQDFILLGISAGAHLSLLQGYKHSDVLKPKGIISFFGPTDLERLYTNSDKSIPEQLKFIMNATLDVNPNIFFESSPINYVTAGSPPTLMLHGDRDKLVPIEQAYMLRDKLEEKEVFNKLVVYPGQGHGWTGADLADSFTQVVAFIKGLAN
ncbi:MAG: alpha/beta hydrolase [Chitinophagaceae bacterium]|nr:alpha/beta hydrolase [Chitinophagaceae bacterium]